MRRRCAPLVLIAALGAGLSACAVVPEPDWTVREGDANDFIQRATAAENSLGGGSLRVTAEDSQPDGGVTLAYESVTSAESFTAACFGGGSVRLGYAVRTGSSWSGSEATEVTCDGGEIQVPLSARIDAIRFHALLVDGAGAVVAAALAGG